VTDELDERLAVARDAAEAAGAALLRLPRGVRAEERGDQLKTAADRASEAWVLAYLDACFTGERVLAEERFDASDGAWDAPARYWTVDALDGTRSFAEGFAGFCVQIAYVADGAPRVAVVHEPALAQTYLAIAGRGAFVARRDGARERLRVAAWPDPPRLVDSTRPSGAAGAWMQRRGAAFVELGSIGLKICRVAEGSADVFAKRLAFKLWDVAPGALVLAEAGGRIGRWDGAPIAFDSETVRYRDLVATAADRFDDVIRELAVPT
jgi:3'-phosphoadenosine 5'-phosphosulfate (PAPS) 3'-phosphatase